MYLLAFIFPPLAILLCGKPFQALFSLLLLVFYFPSVLWALLVVVDHKANARNRAVMANADRNATRQVTALERQTRDLTRALQDQQKSPVGVVQVQQTGPTQPLPQRTNPAVSLTPKPAAVSIARFMPTEPLITIEGVRAFCARVKVGAIQAKDGAIFAYQNLPEWAQPIAWGLAAATPVIIIVAALMGGRV
jgi:hypothetical protein